VTGGRSLIARRCTTIVAPAGNGLMSPTRLLVGLLVVAGLAMTLAACSIATVPAADPGPPPTATDNDDAVSDDGDESSPPTDAERLTSHDCYNALPPRPC
jgi:hypothetical protein